MMYEQRIALVRNLLEGCSSIEAYDKFLTAVQAVKDNTRAIVEKLLAEIAHVKEQEKIQLEAVHQEKK